MKKRIRSLLLTMLCVVTVFSCLGFGSVYAETEQSTISLAPGSDETSVNVNWYANTTEAGVVKYAPTSQLTSDGKLPATAKTVDAATGTASKSGYNYFKATLSDLAPATSYSYTLTNGSTESPVYHFSTQAQGAFTFLFVGDPQIGAGSSNADDTAKWNSALQTMTENYPDSAFLLSAGDQVDNNSDEEQYEGYLNSTYMPNLINPTTVGNHDAGSNCYSQHYNVANMSSDYGVTAAGGDSWFTYNNVLFMSLNDNDMSAAEHKAFMQDAISKSHDASWKIVVMHHSMFTVVSHAYDDDIIARRNELPAIFKELGVDVVLDGHGHVYCRTYMMDGTNPMTDASIYDNAEYSSITNPAGILYVTANSGSGSKFYTIKEDNFPYARVKNQERVPNFSVVSVSDNSFKITTKRTTDLSDVDSFTTYKYDPADYAAVDAAIEKVNALDPDKYEDFDTVTAAINAAVRDKLENEQDTVDGYAAAIESAIAGLKLKSTDGGNTGNNDNTGSDTGNDNTGSGKDNGTTKPDSGNTGKDGGKGTSKPATGDTSNTAVPAAVAVSALGAAVVLIVRRRSVKAADRKQSR